MFWGGYTNIRTPKVKGTCSGGDKGGAAVQKHRSVRVNKGTARPSMGGDTGRFRSAEGLNDDNRMADEEG